MLLLLQVLIFLMFSENIQNTPLKVIKRDIGTMQCRTPPVINKHGTWKKKIVTYDFLNISGNLPSSEFKNIFRNSILSWVSSVDINLVQSKKNPDIRVFFKMDDGVGKTLAYAFYPENGDIYFDQEEDWNANPDGPSFRWAATHELGHALGLDHSDNYSSIMYPYYNDEVKDPTADDLHNMQKLYGVRKLNTSDLCGSSSIDGIVQHNTTLLIKNRKYWTIKNGFLHEGPFLVEEMFNCSSDTINAGFKIGKRVYFFTNNVYHVYNDAGTLVGDKLISVGFEGVPSKIQALLYFKEKKVIYFFTGSKYYQFDIKKTIGKRLVVNGKNIKDKWLGVPNDIDGATFVDNSTILFIKKGICYFYNVDLNKVSSTDNCNTSLYKC